jgi:hypothetical protein
MTDYTLDAETGQVGATTETQPQDPLFGTPLYLKMQPYFVAISQQSNEGNHTARKVVDIYVLLKADPTNIPLQQSAEEIFDVWLDYQTTPPAS